MPGVTVRGVEKTSVMGFGAEDGEAHGGMDEKGGARLERSAIRRKR